MEDLDIENGADSVGGNTITTLDMDDDDEEAVHDQLPSVEEYKTAILNGTSSSPRHSQNLAAASALIAEEDGEDDDVPIHDQLPSVEEVKAAFNPQAKTSRYRKCMRLMISFLVFALIAVAIIVPSVVLTGDSSQSLKFHRSRRTEVVQYLVDRKVSSLADLMTPGKAQYDAATWIADDDGLYMSLPTSDSKHTRFIERYALAVLYYSTNGPSWKFDMKFLEPYDHCNWNNMFVTTSGTLLRLGVNSCREVIDDGTGTSNGSFVYRVGLPVNDLGGTIPDEIESLHRLEVFSAPFNEGLTGKLKSGMRNLIHLEDLEFQYCSLTGAIPDWIGDLKKLTNLGLGNNLLTGALPDSIFQLSVLELLGLDDNLLTADLADFLPLSKLQNLYLEDNEFYGALTEEHINSWTDMIELDMSKNLVNSSLPDNIFSMEKLKVLDLHGNEFHGSIPAIPAVNTKLTFVALYENQLTGAIPPSINNLSNLEHLDLAINVLESPIPSTLGKLTRLRYLFTGSNSFSDHDIPGFISKLTRLRELSMKANSLTGKIPTTIASLTSLQLLDLDQNKLTGPIPEEIGLLKGLDHLMLNRNKLTGTLPTSFAILNDLDVLLIDGNNITGSADIICKDSTVNPSYFVSDCGDPNPELDCTCCHICCHVSNTTCNNYDWHVNLDPIWEYGYTRAVYQFSQELLPPP